MGCGACRMVNITSRRQLPNRGGACPLKHRALQKCCSLTGRLSNQTHKEDESWPGLGLGARGTQLALRARIGEM